jgi:hypothetical protein
MSEKISNKLCISDDISKCDECNLKEKLDCHFNVKKLARFAITWFIVVLSGSIGLVFNGLLFEFTIYLIILIVFSIIFFEFWEIRILCSHCPFYSEEGRTLHCYGNYGCLKIWKYHPEPMSKSEKFQFIIGLVLVFIILNLPSFFLLINRLYLWSILPVITTIIFIWVIRKFHCTYCNNFSCPLNRMPKQVINDFLKRNPLMKEAWEKSGWIVE